MKRILILVVTTLFLFVCTSKPRKGIITFLHTNDMHAQFVPLKATWIDKDPQPLIGGMTALDYYAQKLRAQYPNSLLMDAGDMCTGTLLTKIKHQGAYNGAFIEMMNIMDYDAATIGNHEFDDGQENLRALLSLADFDFVSANLFINDSSIVEPYRIYKVGGLRVGIIGLILSDLYKMSRKSHMQGVRISDPIHTAQHWIDAIDPSTDLIVLLTHQGESKDVELAQNIKNADIIIGGHSHTRLDQVVKENNILLVQAGSKTRYLGRFTVNVAGDTISDYDYQLIPVWVDSVSSPNPRMETLVTAFKKQIDIEYAREIGTLKTPWIKVQRGESNLGNYITDVIRESTTSDFAILNSGGIRKSLPAGPITKKDIYEILPFSNYVMTFSCTGAQLIELLTDNLQETIQDEDGILQVSGISYTYRVEKDSSVSIISLLVDGESVQADQVYRGVTVDFVFDLLEAPYKLVKTETSPDLIADCLVDYIIQHPTVESKVENRIIKVN